MFAFLADVGNDEVFRCCKDVEVVHHMLYIFAGARNGVVFVDTIPIDQHVLAVSIGQRLAERHQIGGQPTGC